MKTRTIGDVTVSAIGFGGMPISIEGRPDEAQAIATIHAALDAGITFIDTADAYRMPGEGFSHNEQLIAKALASYGGDTSNVLVATKGGHLRDDGVIRMAGISNANPEQIRQAQDILGGRLVSVQNQFSPAFRSSEPELVLCDEMKLAFLPWSPLGGIGGAAGLGDRFAPFKTIAAEHGVSAQVICLAWELAKSPFVIPIPGSSRPETIRDSATAADVVLSADELATLDAA